MVTCSQTIIRNKRTEKRRFNYSIKILFGLSPNRIFFEIYCFRDLHFQTLAMTALCGFAKPNRQNGRIV